MHKSVAISHVSKYFPGIIPHVSLLHLYSLYAQVAFAAIQKDLKSNIFRPPFSMVFIITFLDTLSLLFFQRKLNNSLFIVFITHFGTLIAFIKYTTFASAIVLIIRTFP